jgi:hypothetical protein
MRTRVKCDIEVHLLLFFVFFDKVRVYLFGQGYGFLYEILTRFGPERSRENERIAQAIFRGLRLHQAIRRKQGGARNDPHEIRAGVWRQIKPRAKTQVDQRIRDRSPPQR